jgi:gentisate 1,2-dioxygenase
MNIAQYLNSDYHLSTTKSSLCINHKMTSSQENFVQNEAAGPFYDSLPAKNVEPLWLKFEAMVPPRPNPSAQSSIWRYEDIKPLLLDAGKIVPIEEAERRVLMLINPSMQAPCK